MNWVSVQGQSGETRAQEIGGYGRLEGKMWCVELDCLQGDGGRGVGGRGVQ